MAGTPVESKLLLNDLGRKGSKGQQGTKWQPVSRHHLLSAYDTGRDKEKTDAACSNKH